MKTRVYVCFLDLCFVDLLFVLVLVCFCVAFAAKPYVRLSPVASDDDL